MSDSRRLRVLVTGATGFVGRAVCRHLVEAGFAVRACLRVEKDSAYLRQLRGSIEFACVGDIGGEPNWEEALRDLYAIVHLAARVHMTHDASSDPFSEYMRINVSATERLAEAAAQRVRRFVFVSSIKVNGEQTIGKPFESGDTPAPQDPYGISKWEAEKALRRITVNSPMELVVVRPPLVYGPGVRANFFQLMDLVYRGVPLPLPNVRNRRSLIGVENLADVLVRCVEHPAAAGRTFVVSDGEDVSSRELATHIAEAFGRRCRFLPLPERLLRLAAAITNRQAQADRLFGSLVVDSAMARERLDWEPPVSLKEGLAATANWFVARSQRS